MSAIDRLPEHIHYRDVGCDIAPRCLECPLPLCRYDLAPKRAGALLRVAELRRLLAEGATSDAAAARMGISRRTVFRLKHYGAEPLPLVPSGQAGRAGARPLPGRIAPEGGSR
jgi:hypothetical protein